MKKLGFVFAAVAALLLATPVFANGFSFGFGVHHVNTVRTFSFAAPVVARTDAYFSYTPVNLVALPPVATYSLPVQAPVPVQAVDPCTPQAAAPAPVAVQAQVTYAAPTYTYSLFSAPAPVYSVSTYGAGFGVHRFSTVRFAGVNRVVRVDRVVAPVNQVTVSKTVVRNGFLGLGARRTVTRTVTRVR